MKTITFKADDHMDDWLEQQARALRVSKSKIVRDAVEKTRRENAARSCHDLMRAACGSLHSGVKDLATNKKYMKGFGAWNRRCMTEKYRNSRVFTLDGDFRVYRRHGRQVIPLIFPS